MTAKYFETKQGFRSFIQNQFFEIYDTFESIPARVEFDPKVLIKKFFLLSNPFLNES